MSTQGLDVLDIARELVRTPGPNPPGDERATAELVRDLLPELHLPRARTITRHESRPNLLITLDFGPGGRHLVLSGHLDTKPVADATWTVDPFGADIEGDRLYGLGSADMKSALAAMLVAASRLASDAPSAVGSACSSRPTRKTAPPTAPTTLPTVFLCMPTASSSASLAASTRTTTGCTWLAVASPGCVW